MDDVKIIQLYFERNELAIEISNKKYGKYCLSIANNILEDNYEAEECLNDTWFNTWNSIPPKKPNSLKLFLAAITRNLAFNKFKSKKRKKRGDAFTVLLDELEECITVSSAEEEYMASELTQKINLFLKSLSLKEREVFLHRYFYAEPFSKICPLCGIKEETARTILFRTRKKLKDFLEKEGFQT